MTAELEEAQIAGARHTLSEFDGWPIGALANYEAAIERQREAIAHQRRLGRFGLLVPLPALLFMVGITITLVTSIR